MQAGWKGYILLLTPLQGELCLCPWYVQMWRLWRGQERITWFHSIERWLLDHSSCKKVGTCPLTIPTNVGILNYKHNYYWHIREEKKKVFFLTRHLDYLDGLFQKITCKSYLIGETWVWADIKVVCICYSQWYCQVVHKITSSTCSGSCPSPSHP